MCKLTSQRLTKNENIKINENIDQDVFKNLEKKIQPRYCNTSQVSEKINLPSTIFSALAFKQLKTIRILYRPIHTLTMSICPYLNLIYKLYNINRPELLKLLFLDGSIFFIQ